MNLGDTVYWHPILCSGPIAVGVLVEDMGSKFGRRIWRVLANGKIHLIKEQELQHIDGDREGKPRTCDT
jgi:hypothetical protein